MFKLTALLFIGWSSFGNDGDDWPAGMISIWIEVSVGWAFASFTAPILPSLLLNSNETLSSSSSVQIKDN